MSHADTTSRQSFDSATGFYYDVLASGHFVPGETRGETGRYKQKAVWQGILKVTEQACLYYFDRAPLELQPGHSKSESEQSEGPYVAGVDSGCQLAGIQSCGGCLWMPACWHSDASVRVCVCLCVCILDASLLAFSCECVCVCVRHVSGCQLAGIQLRVCVCVLFLDASLLAFSHVPSYLFGFLMFATRLTDSSDLKIDFFCMLNLLMKRRPCAEAAPAHRRRAHRPHGQRVSLVVCGPEAEGGGQC